MVVMQLQAAMAKLNEDTARRAAEEERVKRLISSIPTDARALFAYPMAWDAIERAGVVPSKMRPWISKKLVELLGADDAAVVDFLCGRLAARCGPEPLLQEMASFLEHAEAEQFIAKLWRMLVFHMLSCGGGSS